jgi:SIR2-like domain
MKHYLLIGAGFSRNWGGLLASEAFEYLLGDPAVAAPDSDLRTLLWKRQSEGGFEAALDDLQRDFSPAARGRLLQLEAAVRRMFDLMNAGFKRKALEFRSSELPGDRPVQQFLLRFDAIFSLNQDSFLELHYRGSRDGLVDRNDPRTERSWDLPGMQMAVVPVDQKAFPSATGIWIPTGEHQVPEGTQPIFKLHGSANWRSVEGGELMILGGGKARAIERYPVLAWYSHLFVSLLSRPDARLMLIGYGFRDEHINTALIQAMEAGLRIYIVDPAGPDVAGATNRVPKNAIGYKPTNLEETVQKSLIGYSRRPFSSTLGNDSVEHAKLMRFFEE